MVLPTVFVKIRTFTHPNYARWLNFSFISRNSNSKSKICRKENLFSDWNGICKNCNVHTRWMVIIWLVSLLLSSLSSPLSLSFDISHIITGGQTAFSTTTTTTLHAHIARSLTVSPLHTFFSLFKCNIHYIYKEKKERKKDGCTKTVGKVKKVMVK